MSDNQTGTYLPANRKDYGLPQLPRRIFLDTNVVQCLQTFGEYIYDHYMALEEEAQLRRLGRRMAEDVEALAVFMDLGRRNGWPLAVSRRTLQELSATPEPNKRYFLMQWGGDLAAYFLTLSEAHGTCEPLSYLQRTYLEKEFGYVPHGSDRRLLIDTIELGCDVFLTMDYKSIWRFRSHIARLGITVMRPVELVECIEPWAGLLR